MTQDFKSAMLKYITNNITPGIQQPNEFRDNEATSTDIATILNDRLGIVPTQYKILTTTTTSNYLIYGNYIDDDLISKGFIIILDQNSNVLEILTTFDSGTKLGYIWYLDYDENGNIYGIDEAIDTGKARIILLNNIALETPKGYYCKLRSSYYINVANFHIFDNDGSAPHLIRKSKDEAVYFIIGRYKNGDTWNSAVLKFVNNVGMPNEWVLYTGHTLGTYTIRFYDMLVDKVGDDYNVYISYTSDDMSILKSEQLGESSLTGYTELDMDTPIMCIRIMDKDTTYFTSRVNNNNGTYTMYLYLYKNSQVTLRNASIIEASSPSYYLYISNGILYGIARGYSENGGVLTFNNICIAYYSGQTFISDIITYTATSNINFNTVVQSTFSLHKFILLSNEYIYHPSLVIYENMYTGGAYTDYGSASAQKGEIYSDGYIVFARGLYNKQIYNNQTTSTLEIPNGYLNDIVLDNKNVLSQTNNVLIQDTTEIQKNIYETLFLNFTNSISVIDEDTSTTYPSVANYINANTNIGTETNYNDTTMGKIRIRYTDHVATTPITWVSIDSTHYKIETTVDATTEVPYLIEFISNDETTTYLSKELPLTLGNYYKITQKIRIE